jgi:uncharacterized protein YlxW (UPF0749 family)
MFVMSATITLFALLIPLLAIGGSFYVKLEKMRLENGGVSNSDKKRLDKLEEENHELRERVSNLETIITSFDKDILALQPQQLSEAQIQQQVEALARKIAQGK